MMTRKKKVRPYKAGVLGRVEKTYLVDWRTCWEDDNMVSNLVNEKDDVPLIGKWKNLIGSLWYRDLAIWKLFGGIVKADGSHRDL